MSTSQDFHSTIEDMNKYIQDILNLIERGDVAALQAVVTSQLYEHSYDGNGNAEHTAMTDKVVNIGITKSVIEQCMKHDRVDCLRAIEGQLQGASNQWRFMLPLAQSDEMIHYVASRLHDVSPFVMKSLAFDISASTMSILMTYVEMSDEHIRQAFMGSVMGQNMEVAQLFLDEVGAEDRAQGIVHCVLNDREDMIDVLYRFESGERALQLRSDNGGHQRLWTYLEQKVVACRTQHLLQCATDSVTLSARAPRSKI